MKAKVGVKGRLTQRRRFKGGEAAISAKNEADAPLMYSRASQRGRDMKEPLEGF